MLLKPDVFCKLKSSTCAHVIFASIFWCFGLLLNFLQLVLYITIRPISKNSFRILNSYIFQFMLSKTVFLWQWWSGSEIHLYVIDEDLEKFKTESKVLIINHSYEIDWLVMFSLYETTGQLGGVKDFTKAENRWIPIAGWIMFFAEWIGLRRNFKSDKKVIEHGVREVFSFPFTVSLNYYAEGTRFTKSKHKNSVEFAQKRGLTPLQNLLIPRTKGFTTFLPIIKTTSEALYDVIIAFKENEGANPIIMNVLNGQKMIAHVYLKRIPLTEIPDNEIEASLWLQSLYREKDFKITKFKKNGNFGKVNQILTKSFHVLICEVITFLVLYSGILWILIYTILQGNFTLLSVVITIFGLLYVTLLQVTKFSEVKSRDVL